MGVCRGSGKSVHIVDPCVLIGKTLSTVLSKDKSFKEIKYFTSIEDYNTYKQKGEDCIVLFGLHFVTENGLNVIKKLKEMNKFIKVIALLAEDTTENIGADVCISLERNYEDIKAKIKSV